MTQVAMVRLIPLVAAVLTCVSPARALAGDGRSTIEDPWAAVPSVLDVPERTEQAPDHRALSVGLVAGGYAAFSVWAYYAWYWGVPTLGRFKVGGDGYFGAETYAGGADKLGHAWINHVLTRASFRTLRWGGWRDREAALIGGGLTAVLFTLVEIKDGYYYQMSPGDLVANTAGAVLALAMEFSPRVDELLDFRVEYWPSEEYRAILRGEAEAEINKANVAEDYSGQRYLIALHAGAVAGLRDGRWTRWTRWVDATVGFHADNYKPDPLPADGEIRRQSLYLGISLNAQGILDDVLAGPGGRRHARAIGHGFFEMMNIPFTSLPVVDASREGMDVPP